MIRTSGTPAGNNFKTALAASVLLEKRSELIEPSVILPETPLIPSIVPVTNLTFLLNSLDALVPLDRRAGP